MLAWACLRNKRLHHNPAADHHRSAPSPHHLALHLSTCTPDTLCCLALGHPPMKAGVLRAPQSAGTSKAPSHVALCPAQCHKARVTPPWLLMIAKYLQACLLHLPGRWCWAAQIYFPGALDILGVMGTDEGRCFTGGFGFTWRRSYCIFMAAGAGLLRDLSLWLGYAALHRNDPS